MPIPTIDLSTASDATSHASLVAQIKSACETHGFFQLVGHGIPQRLLDDALAQSESFFSLPLDVKTKYDKNIGGFNRGYEPLRAQHFEKNTAGDLKEGFYLGQHLPASHPLVVANKFNLGPNKYPEEVADPERFRRVVDDYLAAALALAESLFRLICETLGVGDAWVADFCQTPIATLRLLHYPPQAPDASDSERGIGAHTDFGALTILLQDPVGGLQVWDRTASPPCWTDVTPQRGALVVNLGNLMMRWTNDRYLSNLHRVINLSGRERYSLPFFFSGNPDFVVECFPGEEAKYPAVTVGDWIKARYADTYGTGDAKAGELSTEAAS